MGNGFSCLGFTSLGLRDRGVVLEGLTVRLKEHKKTSVRVWGLQLLGSGVFREQDVMFTGFVA